MNVLRNSRGSVRSAAVVAAIGFAGIAVFQLALATGVPLGKAAWGGGHADLSTAERVASAVAVFVWSAAALTVLGCAGFWGSVSRATLFRRGTWLLAAVSLLAAVMNFASKSIWENAIFGPLALVLAMLCTIVARNGRERAHGKAHKPAAATH